MKRKHLRSGGAIPFESDEAATKRASRWRPGPSSIAELNDWPRANADSILGNPEMACRLFTTMSRPICVYSDYSGYASEVESLNRGFPALQQVGRWPVHLSSPFRFERTCDVGLTQLDVLQAISSDCTSGRMCVMKDVLDHMTPEARRHVEQMTPSKSSGRQQCEEAYTKMLSWLFEHRAMAFPQNLMQWCHVHQRDCPVHPSMKPAYMQDSGGETGALFVNIAGVTCDGWSSMGKQGRFGHASEQCHSVYVCERRVRAEQECEDIVFTECTKKYPIADKMQKPLMGTHHVVWTVTGPELFGHPVRRMRVLGASINRSRLAWVGPSSQEGIVAEFERLFYRAVMVGGGEYFCAPDKERHSMYADLAAGQTNHIPMEQIESMPDISPLLPSLLPVGQTQRLEQWLQRRAEFESPGGELLADLDHNMPMKRGGVLWPTQLTHGTVAHLPRGGPVRLATALEHLGAQGYCVYSQGACGTCETGSASTPVSPLVNIFRGLSAGKTKELVGRGIHVAVLSAWMFYVFANIVPLRRKADIRMLRGLSFASDADDDVE